MFCSAATVTGARGHPVTSAANAIWHDSHPVTSATNEIAAGAVAVTVIAIVTVTASASCDSLANVTGYVHRHAPSAPQRPPSLSRLQQRA